MLSLNLPQRDASQSGKWIPTDVRRFLFAPVILLSLVTPRTFSCPHSSWKFQSLVVLIENYAQLGQNKNPFSGSLNFKESGIRSFFRRFLRNFNLCTDT